ncbi:MAG: hypothetical protein OXE42_01680 [Gammaproteobacteria bacterium]|nr:hypothetical protein [Gammaproteobacteria bacterium]
MRAPRPWRLTVWWYLVLRRQGRKSAAGDGLAVVIRRPREGRMAAVLDTHHRHGAGAAFGDVTLGGFQGLSFPQGLACKTFF